ncbi:hypothetical protein V511_00335 [Mesotoga sp. Brook.08.YT.4.2.5.1]|uniref:DUF3798 domain-containing protein n=1 Tax=unclassified Mesotoga TaxID=1184398 RepID=UPI000C17F8F7|nr:MULTISPECIES: DUF3798 domain-containing protein [unclassified Mesotoga]PNQ05479.1 hypothetical protein RM69_04645 [Mesotoga sp. SC_NapDC3]PXF34555.1 hypothetical protein EU77_06880 [Mesotoga sp. SC_NapDC]PNE23710.1 hypothetical protein V511_00420 [Mesotoga sp. Brook.08.YT.4.2.5.1]PNE23721.1 hypothetical protein V511_00335 [Mesotoga sp. Brook.08.YT.4.2.5.1]PNS40417.1 hypothetical protein RJ60_06635 [Mesotoga sp. B105.6.4]
MRKALLVLLVVLVSAAFMFAANYHIGVVTGTVSQSEDDLRGAEALIKKYGDAASGGMIVHLTYPDNFMSEQETVIAQITGLADDPLMKAIIVNQAIPGTVESFRRIRETRPDILLLAGLPHEDPPMLADAAHLSVNADSLARGYLIIYTAKQLGAEKFMHISFPRHMSYELLSKRRDIMRASCEELGLEFIDMGSPDPVGDVGIAGAQQFILEKVPAWLDEYGANTAFFCTNDAHTEPLLKRVAELGGFFIEADLPSPLMGYPGALGISFTEEETGNWPAILAKVEEAVVAKGGAGRMGTWAYSLGYTTTAALAEHAKNVIDGKCEIDDFDAVMATFAEYTPGAGWNGSYYIDADGIEQENYLLIYQDTYIFGKGYMGITEVEVPAKFLNF